MIYSYDLCGLPLQIECAEDLPVTGELELFRGEKNIRPEGVYRVSWYHEPPELPGQRIVTQWGYTVDQADDTYIFRFNVGYTRNPYCVILIMNASGSEYSLLLPEQHRELLHREGVDLARLLGQELLFVRNQRLIMHASFVRCRGKGILFTGPSGMGKSTQAGLWERHVGAEVLNGDKTVLHVGQDQVTAWGSPYAGTSGIFRNESAPAAAIVALRQSAENSIRRLRGREALMELMPRLATAPWANQWHLQAMDLAIKLVSHVPVYLLSCRPDRDAVDMLKREIFGEGCL